MRDPSSRSLEECTRGPSSRSTEESAKGHPTRSSAVYDDSRSSAVSRSSTVYDDSSESEDRKAKHEKNWVNPRKRSDSRDRYSLTDDEDKRRLPNRCCSPIERHIDENNLKGKRKFIRDPSSRSLEECARGPSSKSSEVNDSSESATEDLYFKHKKKHHRKRSDSRDRYSLTDDEDKRRLPNRSCSPIERHIDENNLKGKRKSVRDPSSRSLEECARGLSTRSAEESARGPPSSSKEESARGHSTRSSEKWYSSDIEDRHLKDEKKHIRKRSISGDRYSTGTDNENSKRKTSRRSPSIERQSSRGTKSCEEYNSSDSENRQSKDEKKHRRKRSDFGDRYCTGSDNEDSKRKPFRRNRSIECQISKENYRKSQRSPSASSSHEPTRSHSPRSFKEREIENRQFKVDYRKPSDFRNRYFPVTYDENRRRRPVSRSRSPIECYFRNSLGRDHKDMGPNSLRSQSPREHDSDQNISRRNRNPTATDPSIGYSQEYNSCDTKKHSMENKDTAIRTSRSPIGRQGPAKDFRDCYTPMSDTENEIKPKRGCSELEEDGYSSKVKANRRPISNTSVRCPPKQNFSDEVEVVDFEEGKRKLRGCSPKRQADEYGTTFDENETYARSKKPDNCGDRYSTVTGNKEGNVDDDIYSSPSDDAHKQQNSNIRIGRSAQSEELKSESSRRNYRTPPEQVPLTAMRKVREKRKAA